jgi:hypothetical protein
MSGAAGDGARRANAADEDVPHGEDFEGGYDEEEEDEDGYEFGDAEEAMQCVEMAERSTDARAHGYEALAARKRKALTEEQPQRYQNFLLGIMDSLLTTKRNSYPWVLVRPITLTITMLHRIFRHFRT